eukprot:scaffold579_cov129-Isochrysis_galbana.AAC.2
MEKTADATNAFERATFCSLDWRGHGPSQPLSLVTRVLDTQGRVYGIYSDVIIYTYTIDT